MSGTKFVEPMWAVKLCEDCPYPDCIQCLGSFVNEERLKRAYKTEMKRRETFTKKDYVKAWIRYVHIKEPTTGQKKWDPEGFVRCYNLGLEDAMIADYMRVHESFIVARRMVYGLPPAPKRKSRITLDALKEEFV